MMGLMPVRAAAGAQASNLQDEKGETVICRGVEATGSEVVKLAEEVVRSVKEKFGVAIHPEVNFIGVKQ